MSTTLTATTLENRKIRIECADTDTIASLKEKLTNCIIEEVYSESSDSESTPVCTVTQLPPFPLLR